MEQDPPLLPIAWEKMNDAWYTYVKGHTPNPAILGFMMSYVGTPSGSISETPLVPGPGGAKVEMLAK